MPKRIILLYRYHYCLYAIDNIYQAPSAFPYGQRLQLFVTFPLKQVGSGFLKEGIYRRPLFLLRSKD